MFADVDDDRLPQEPAVQGMLPSWLHGTYVRNGPARFDFPGDASVAHWFDGMAYLQRFTFEDGRVRLATRFVQSRAYHDALDGKRTYDAFGTAAAPSLRSILGRPFGATFTDNPNVNVARYGDRLVALTEVGLPRCFDLETLETSGEFLFDDNVGGGYTTAHPCFWNGCWINYTLKFGPTSRYIVWSMDAHGVRTVLATIASKRPSYIHSMAVSERYAILIEYPFSVNPLALVFSGKAFIENFSWNAAAPSRLHVVDLRGIDDVRTCEAPPFFCFHSVCAYDDGLDILLDLVGYDDASIVDDLRIEPLREGKAVRAPGMSLRRYRISPKNGTATRETIAPEPLRIELPRANLHARRPRFYYGPRFGEAAFASDALLRVNVENGTVDSWSRPDEAPAEAVFVSRPGASDEDDGVLLTVIRSSERHASALVVLDARSFEECARVWVGVPLPLGFHGQFFR